MLPAIDELPGFVASPVLAIVAILAGSRAHGVASPASDDDVILLFESLPNGTLRKMTLFERQHVEVFAHDVGTLAYFCRAMPPCCTDQLG